MAPLEEKAYTSFKYRECDFCSMAHLNNTQVNKRNEHVCDRSEGMSSRGISSLSAKRRGADWVQVFHCCRRRRHPTLFFIKRVCNNDFGVFRKSPEAKFHSGSLQKPPGSPLGHQKSIFSKKTKIQKIPKIKNLQNWAENQQLRPKLTQDDSPSLSNPFPTIFGQIPAKNPPKIPENPLTSIP